MFVIFPKTYLRFESYIAIWKSEELFPLCWEGIISYGVLYNMTFSIDLKKHIFCAYKFILQDGAECMRS